MRRLPSFQQFINEDRIKGGLADKKTPEDIADKHGVSIDTIKDQIEKGIKVEMEHVDDAGLAKEIAMDHLMEMPDYYDRLADMEDEAEVDERFLGTGPWSIRDTMSKEELIQIYRNAAEWEERSKEEESEYDSEDYMRARETAMKLLQRKHQMSRFELLRML